MSTKEDILKRYCCRPSFDPIESNTGFKSVTQCKSCTIIGTYTDCHIVNPCHWCGGQVELAGAARWQAIPTGKTKEYFFGLFTRPEVVYRWVFNHELELLKNL